MFVINVPEVDVSNVLLASLLTSLLDSLVFLVAFLLLTLLNLSITDLFGFGASVVGEMGAVAADFRAVVGRGIEILISLSFRFTIEFQGARLDSAPTTFRASMSKLMLFSVGRGVVSGTFLMPPSLRSLNILKRGQQTINGGKFRVE